jgi:cephalosporin hydroxylase
MEVTLNPSGRTERLPDEVIALAQAAQSGMMDASELQCLAATLALYPWGRQQEEVVVEIGAFKGATTVFMAKVLRTLGRRVPILSIDPFERATPDDVNPQGVQAAYLQNVRVAGFEDLCLPLAAFSQHAAAVVPNRIAVLIVDGSHHYDAVKSDLALYGRKVLPDGLMFVDDYTPAYPGVMAAVDEYFGPDAPFDLLHKSYFVIAQRRHGPGGGDR